MYRIKWLPILIISIMAAFLWSQGTFAYNISLLDTDDRYAYIKGYEDGSFRPGANITRAEAMSILTRVLKEKPEETKNYNCTFTDIKKNAWYFRDLGFLEEKGIIAGYSDHTIRPQNNITRAEFMIMLVTAAGMATISPNSSSPFTDVTPTYWAYNAIVLAHENNWTSGYPNGKFLPDGKITRAEAVSIVSRILGHTINQQELQSYDGPTFKDITSNHWAYGAIMDAATGGYYYTIPVLVYHYLAMDQDCVSGGQYYGNSAVLSVRVFNEQMNYLKKNNYNTIFVSELYEAIKAGKMPPKNSVVLMFDDGYLSDYEFAYPILNTLDLKGNLAPIIYESKITTETPELQKVNFAHTTFPQIKEMVDSGCFQVGSHSYSGHGLIPIDPKGNTNRFFLYRKYLFMEERFETETEFKNRIYYDLSTGKNLMSQKIESEVNFFVYPYGAYNDELIAAVQDTAFQCAFTLGNTKVSLFSELYTLPRCTIFQNITLNEFISLL